ncbi:hypothetical protein ACFV4M_02910 [Kitasatospora indigofera]|uniref:hypothetical protein n=1 Tax=Kitasatospora indigofera TaxID=67307 RepID=UPI00365DDD5A
MRPVVSAAVAGGPARPEAVAALAGRLRGLDPVRVVHADPATALVRAWRSAAGTGSTHHLVVRDDAELTPAVTARLARTRSLPWAALALSVQRGSWNAGAAWLAALRGCGWVTAVPQDCLPPLAVLLPSELAPAFAEFAETALAAGGSPDRLLPQFARQHRLELLIHVAGPATRRPALARWGTGAGTGLRRRPSGGPAPDRVSPFPEVLPRLRAGRTTVALWDAGTATWRRAPWTDHMARTGRNWPAVAPAAAFMAISDGPPPRARERILPLAEVVRYGLAVGTVLGRAPAETSAPMLRRRLGVAVLDAVGSVPEQGWPSAWTDELADVLWRAVGIGARLRSNHGVGHWPLDELRRLPADAPPCGDPPAQGPARALPGPAPVHRAPDPGLAPSTPLP